MQKTWIRILTTLMTIGIMLLIFLFSTEPAEQSDSTSGIISEKVADTIRPGWRQLAAAARKAFYDSVQYAVRKCAHFTEFTVLGLSLRLCLESWFDNQHRTGLPAWITGTGYAILDELHQLAVDGRSGQWRDVLIDSAGVLAGVLLAALLIKPIRKHIASDGQNKTIGL